MKKSGLSTVVTSLILILLVLVSVAIIWVVIQNILSDQSEEVDIDDFLIDIEIEKVLQEDQETKVTIKRKPGKGEIYGIKFIISDGTASHNFDIEDITLNELGSQTFQFPYAGPIKTIAAIPTTKSEEGTIQTLKTQTQKEFSDSKAVENMPLLSWWRFEGNANDEMGNVDGTLNGPTITQGKFGQAYKFDGVDDYIDLPNPSLLNKTSDMTIAMWVKPGTYQEGIIFSLGGSSVYFSSYTNSAGYPFIQRSTVNIHDNTPLPQNTFTHIAGSGNSTHITLYLNGNAIESVASIPPVQSPIIAQIGKIHLANLNYFNGTIDEVMVFNTTLSDENIKALANLDLSD